MKQISQNDKSGFKILKYKQVLYESLGIFMFSDFLL